MKLSRHLPEICTRPESLALLPIAEAVRRMARPSRALAFTALVAGVGLTPQSAQARAVPFNETDISTTTDGAFSVAGADFDGDGSIDLLSAALNADEIAWYQNDGSQNYSKRLISVSIDGPVSVFAADVDSDGDMDVLSAASNGNRIDWFRNDGVGNFSHRTIHTGISAAFSVFAADIDSDGDVDVVTAAFSGDQVAWFENDGAENFTQRVISTNADGARSVFAADVDGDGDVDVLSASTNDDKIAWYENDGSQNFTQRVISTNADGARSVFAVDIDGDGDMDVLSASTNDDKIAWYENNGSQVFTLHTISVAADGAQSVRAVDMDDDGDMDVVSASRDDGKIAWYENNGSQSFTLRTISLNAPFAYSVFAVDVDSDGDQDLLSTSFSDDSVTIYENKTIHRSAVFPDENIISTNLSRVSSAVPADVDGDGDLDVIASVDGEDRTSWFANDGSGVFSTERIINPDVGGAKFVRAADLDNDGDLDIISSPGAGAVHLEWQANDGIGNFGTPIQIVSGSSSGLSTADLDGDGDLDVLRSRSSSNTIYWYQNDGSGGFGPEQIVTTIPASPNSVSAAELDGDGDLDVLASSSLDDTVAWFRNNGTGVFGTRRVISTLVDNAQAAYAVDLDGDGDLDVVTASFNDDTISWFANNGSGSFGAMQVISTLANSARWVWAEDLDGDGDEDVLSASSLDDKIAWYENNGSGGFGPQIIISNNANGAAFVTTGDLDGDGDIDVLSTSPIDDKIAWHPNRGGQFALPAFDLVPASVTSGAEDVALLRIDFAHRGRSGDADIDSLVFTLKFDDGSGTALTTAQLDDLIGNLSLYLDDGDSDFDPQTDTLLAQTSNITLNPGGILSLSLGSTVSSQVGNDAILYFAFDIEANADQQSPSSFRVSLHQTNLSGAAQDVDSNVPLTLEFSEDVASGVIAPIPPDTTPDAYDFIDRVDRDTAQRVNSNLITISGVEAPTPISIDAVGISEMMSINGGPLISGPSVVSNGDTVRISVLSAAAPNTTRFVDVNIGGVLETWNVTTGATDETPAPLVFNDVTGAAAQQTILSNTITLTQFNAPTAIEIRGAASARYSINGGPFVSTPGTVNPGDTLQLQMASSSQALSARRAVIIVGRIRGRWQVTTGS